MNHNTKSLLALLAIVFCFFSLTGSLLKAQYSYELIDTEDDITATWDTTELIPIVFTPFSETTVSATSSNSDFNTFEFVQDLILRGAPGSDDPGPSVDRLYLQDTDTGGAYIYDFSIGAFSALGTYDSPYVVDGGATSGELIISAVPEPSTWCLMSIGVLALLGWATRRRARQISSKAIS